MKLILLRHGESQWNLENRFTGWEDVSLTESGIDEAMFSGHQLLESDIQIKSIYTSILKRATETTKIVSDILNFPQEKIQQNWRLNERHYGALQGLNKSETALKYGEKQVLIWRRSYATSPPFLDKNDVRHPRFNHTFKNIKHELPVGESLKDVVNRISPFWGKYIKYIKENLGNHLIVAHSNSLRAIVKTLDNLSDSDITNVNIPTGVPLVYNLNDELAVINKKYLIDPKKLKTKLDVVVNQGKIK